MSSSIEGGRGMSYWYILDGREVRPVDTYEEFTAWRKSVDPGPPTLSLRVAADDVNDVHVSTVFLGMDHAWGDGPPLVFETMTFDHRPEKACDEWQWRYATLDQAEAGHREIVAAIAAGHVPSEDAGGAA